MDWYERYSESEFVYGTEPNEFLVSVVGRIPKGTVFLWQKARGETQSIWLLLSRSSEPNHDIR